MTTESQCPFGHGSAGTTNRDWWPNQLRLDLLNQHSHEVQSAGRGLRLRRGLQEARLHRAEERPGAADDRFAGLVAGRLRPLRRPVRAHGLAQRRHLPHRRWPRRRRPRTAALRAAEQLAGQRQPGQGAPPAVADQAEVRPGHLVGRPDDPDRQRRAGDDGLQDLRLRRAAAKTCGNPTTMCTGAARSGWAATSATAWLAGVASDGVCQDDDSKVQRAISRTRWPPCRWA